MHVKLMVAVGAAFAALRMPKQTHDVLHIRIIMQDPWGSDGAVISRVYQRKRICKFTWILIYGVFDIRVFTDPAFVLFADESCQRPYGTVFLIDIS